MDIVFALVAGIGFSAVAGVRAFLPLVITLSAVFFATIGNPPFLFVQVSGWLSLPVIIALLVLLVLEIVLDKFASLERPMNWAMVPVRAVSGAVVFAIAVVEWDPAGVMGPMSTFRGLTLPDGLSILAPYLITGAVVAGTVAVLKVILRPPANVESSGVSTKFLSVVEDVTALVGGIVPFLGALLTAFLLFFFYRIRKRRGRKYGGLRILGD